MSHLLCVFTNVLGENDFAALCIFHESKLGLRFHSGGDRIVVLGRLLDSRSGIRGYGRNRGLVHCLN